MKVVKKTVDKKLIVKKPVVKEVKKIAKKVFVVTPTASEEPTNITMTFQCPDCNLTGWKGGQVCTTCKGTPVK